MEHNLYNGLFVCDIVVITSLLQGLNFELPVLMYGMYLYACVINPLL